MTVKSDVIQSEAERKNFQMEGMLVDEEIKLRTAMCRCSFLKSSLFYGQRRSDLGNVNFGSGKNKVTLEAEVKRVAFLQTVFGYMKDNITNVVASRKIWQENVISITTDNVLVKDICDSKLHFFYVSNSRAAPGKVGGFNVYNDLKRNEGEIDKKQGSVKLTAFSDDMSGYAKFMVFGDYFAFGQQKTNYGEQKEFEWSSANLGRRTGLVLEGRKTGDGAAEEMVKDLKNFFASKKL